MVQAPQSAFGKLCRNNGITKQWSESLIRLRDWPQLCNTQSESDNSECVFWLGVFVCVCMCMCTGQWSQLIPWESIVSLDHLGSSRGRNVAPVSHQADDRRVRALHAALISAMIASLHRPYLCFIYSLSDNNKCLLSAILNYIFISLLTSLKQTSIVCRDFKSMWHLLPRDACVYRWGVKGVQHIYYVFISQAHLLSHHKVNSF